MGRFGSPRRTRRRASSCGGSHPPTCSRGSRVSPRRRSSISAATVAAATDSRLLASRTRSNRREPATVSPPHAPACSPCADRRCRVAVVVLFASPAVGSRRRATRHRPRPNYPQRDHRTRRRRARRGGCSTATDSVELTNNTEHATSSWSSAIRANRTCASPRRRRVSQLRRRPPRTSTKTASATSEIHPRRTADVRELTGNRSPAATRSPGTTTALTGCREPTHPSVAADPSREHLDPQRSRSRSDRSTTVPQITIAAGGELRGSPTSPGGRRFVIARCRGRFARDRRHSRSAPHDLAHGPLGAARPCRHRHRPGRRGSQRRAARRRPRHAFHRQRTCCDRHLEPRCTLAAVGALCATCLARSPRRIRRSRRRRVDRDAALRRRSLRRPVRPPARHLAPRVAATLDDRRQLRRRRPGVAHRRHRRLVARPQRPRRCAGRKRIATHTA